MTKQEFEKRTGVEVSAYEFECINFVYMQADADCDKDVFCKMWKKMNANRVKNAKVERMQKAREEAYRDALHKFYNKTKDEDDWTPMTYVKISAYEVQALAHANIILTNDCGSGVKCLFDVRYEIGKYLGMY